VLRSLKVVVTCAPFLYHPQQHFIVSESTILKEGVSIEVKISLLKKGEDEY
jgi:hypothetical protein